MGRGDIVINRRQGLRSQVIPGKSCPWRRRLPGRAGCVVQVFCVVCLGRIQGQTNPSGACKDTVSNAGSHPTALDPQPKHILGIFPNHNASPCLVPYVPIGAKDKFNIARADAFDPGAIVVAAGAAGAAQLFDSNRPFGQEASGYSRYFGAAYANHVIGDFLTEGVYPSLLHQDPRYFRKSIGSTRSRLGYAISRVFRTQTDAGGTTFNYSRVLGASSAVAISSLYYANHRDAAGSAAGFSAQLGAAMAANILKEFWPDLLRRISRKHQGLSSPVTVSTISEIEAGR
jgi:hypothetical protein